MINRMQYGLSAWGLAGLLSTMVLVLASCYTGRTQLVPLGGYGFGNVTHIVFALPKGVSASEPYFVGERGVCDDPRMIEFVRQLRIKLILSKYFSREIDPKYPASLDNIGVPMVLGHFPLPKAHRVMLPTAGGALEEHLLWDYLGMPKGPVPLGKVGDGSYRWEDMVRDTYGKKLQPEGASSARITVGGPAYREIGIDPVTIRNMPIYFGGVMGIVAPPDYRADPPGPVVHAVLSISTLDSNPTDVDMLVAQVLDEYLNATGQVLYLYKHASKESIADSDARVEFYLQHVSAARKITRGSSNAGPSQE